MIKQFIPEGVCLSCQGCCRFREEYSAWSPSLTGEEVENFSRQGLPASLISVEKKIRVVSFDKEGIFICSLFNPEKNKCKIYESRPLECRLYPFLLNRKDKKIFLAVDTQCDYARDRVKTREFSEYAQYLAELLKSPQYTDILKNNPHLIQVYTDTFEICEL